MRTPWKRARWLARNRWRTLFRNFELGAIRRETARILAADLAHARSLGWKAPLLLLSLWPTLPFAALERVGPAGGYPLFASWPEAGETASPARSGSRDRLAG
jgi:hypothetical protein